MAALTFVQNNSANSTIANPTLAFTSSTTGSSILFAIFAVEGATTISGVPTDTLLNTWVLLGTLQNFDSQSNNYGCWYVPSNNAAGGANTVSFKSTSSGVTNIMGLMEFTGQALVNPLDNVNQGVVPAGGGLMNLPSVTLAGSNEEVICLMACAAGASFTQGTNYTKGLTAANGCFSQYGAFSTSPQTPTATMPNIQSIVTSLSIKSTSTVISSGGGGSWIPLLGAG